MIPIRIAAIVLATGFFSPFAKAQVTPKDPWYSLSPRHRRQSLTLPVNRWIVSFNPLGLAEPMAAVGVGIGYRFSDHVELWSETSFLTNSYFGTPQGPLTGVRAILQGKYFIGGRPDFFIALEGRFKSYQYRSKDEFYNPETHDTLHQYSNFSHYYFWGGAAQVGWRHMLSRNGRLQLELTIGLGGRVSFVDRTDVPKGYKYGFYSRSKDLSIFDDSGDTYPVYHPGSARLIWLFGKRLRP